MDALMQTEQLPVTKFHALLILLALVRPKGLIYVWWPVWDISDCQVQLQHLLASVVGVSCFVKGLELCW